MLAETVKLAVGCQWCGNRHVFTVGIEGLERWKNGELIQNALPELTADERELLISRTCGKCWDEMFPAE